jgi:hypothetical protein
MHVEHWEDMKEKEEGLYENIIFAKIGKKKPIPNEIYLS